MTALPTAFSGVGYLIKVEDPGAAGTYRTVGGLKSTGGSIDGSQFDTTTKDGSRWQRMITGGVQKMAISGGGCFVDDPALQYLTYLIMNNLSANFKLVSDNGEVFAGNFFLKTNAGAGPVTAAIDYTISLESNGTITYTAPAPTVTTVLPATGVAAGGTPIVITGTKFQLGATVMVGGVACTAVVVVDQTTINCTTGAHAAGLVNVVVTNFDAQASTGGTGKFTYT